MLNDLRERALALHGAGVIQLDKCHNSYHAEYEGTIGDAHCLSCGGTGFNLSDGEILLACVKAGVQVQPKWNGTQVVSYYGKNLSVVWDGSVMNQGPYNTPTEAAITALEATL
tara:strand:+ start:5624 stop:5962 length:339 start_codon:yes stop_codon:yes gene_type:complete